MPHGLDAQRAAATDALSKSLRALRCAAILIAVESCAIRERELGIAMLADIDRGERALEVLRR